MTSDFSLILAVLMMPALEQYVQQCLSIAEESISEFDVQRNNLLLKKRILNHVSMMF